jgi:polyphosphate kinase
MAKRAPTARGDGQKTIERDVIPEDVDVPDRDLFFNRELSWLAFNDRVLQLAEDASMPLLERVKFCAIYARNLDEFFMIRVARLHEQLRTEGEARLVPDGATPGETLDKQAVEDPDVLAIKQTVYRTSDSSPLVPALIRATEGGKQAVCMVELKARFDERANIRWAIALEEALNIRGICCLRPGVPGVSENIRVVSILGRFLEHARIYLFERGGEARCFIGSADLMPRNLDHRVEALAPVEDPQLLAQVRDILERCLADNTHAWELDASGTWRRRAQQGEKRWAQGELMDRAVRLTQATSGRPLTSS